MRRSAGAVVLAAAAALCAWAAPAALAAPQDCVECHKDDAADAKARFPLGDYAKSTHAKVACTECPRRAAGSFDAVPHAKAEPDLTGCRACHGLNLKEFNTELTTGVHGDLKCNECHDAHTITLKRELEERAVRTQRANAGCIRCHEHSDLAKEGKGHEWLPSREKHAQMRCIVCHAPVASELDHQIVKKAGANRNCEGCHSGNAAIVEKYLGSAKGGGNVDRSKWVTNPVLFEKAYVPGATRHRLADAIILGIFALTVLGTLGHGLLRWIAASRRAKVPYDVETSFIYAKSLRLWHWTNALLMLGLAITGLRIHFGGREKPILSFEEAFNIHVILGVVLLPVTIWFFVRNAMAGDTKQYLGKPEDGLRGIFRQIGYYKSGVFRGDDHPYHVRKERRFNPLQQVTYAGIMYVLVPLVAISGTILLFSDMFPERIAGRPGGWWFATAHYLLGCGVVAFLLGHLYLATTGDKPSYNFKAMWDGLHRAHKKKPPSGGAPPK
jgi:thiosulfate reductase cytochrome b subunit